MGRKNKEIPDRMRQLVAQETARIIVNQGLRDYRIAKQKAAEKLGMSRYGALPSNEEIEQAVSSHLLLFGRESHNNFLNHARQVAQSIMLSLAPFDPRLAGPVLTGTADANCPIELHLFSDSPERVAAHLTDHGLNHKLFERRMKTRRDQFGAFAGFAFMCDGVATEATVFPRNGIRQAPMCPINGKPMRRADIKAVKSLIEAV